jgi:hypothetical protein
MRTQIESQHTNVRISKTMVLAQHPATEVLSAILPSELCRIICEFAAPHAPPTITALYRLTRYPHKEELTVVVEGSRLPHLATQYVRRHARTRQHIVEISPNTRYGITCSSREIRVSSHWSRERERYGLGRKNKCLCQRLSPARLGPGLYRPDTCQDSSPRPDRCPQTWGPLALHHLRRPLPQLQGQAGHDHPHPPDSCELRGWGLFGIRRYQKWVWSIHDEGHWIDESCGVNKLMPPHEIVDAQLADRDPEAQLRDKVKLLMEL